MLMGYECGFSSIDKRFIKNLPSDKFYESLDGITTDVKNAIEQGKKDCYGIPIGELEEIYHTNEFGYSHLNKEFDYWCSIGRHLTQFMHDEGIISFSNDICYYLTKDYIVKLLAKLCDKFFAPKNIKHYKIEYGLKRDEEDYDEYTLKSIPIDGVELLNTETMEYSKILSIDDEDDFCYIDASFDIDGVYSSAIRCLIKILKEVDFDKEQVYFWESY